MAGINLLTATRVKSLSLPAKGKQRVSDGGGLYLVLRATGSKAWIYMWKRDGRTSEIGLGSLTDLSLSDARRLATIARREVAEGHDPRDALRPNSQRTFEETAVAVIKMKTRGRGAKTNQQWERDLMGRCKTLHKRPIENISRADILKILRPVWINTPESGRRFRARLEALFGYAIALGWRDGDNPAVWKNGLQHILPPHTDNVNHHRSLPWQEVPAFMEELSKRDAISARALEFTILTATRTTAALHAKWEEFDLNSNVWTVPGERMKAKDGKLKPHAVPLSPQAVAIIVTMGKFKTGPYVFPGQKSGKPLSNMAMLNLLKERMKVPYTVHGFRSSFRDWVGEATEYPRELPELSLAHSVGNATERAYRRGKALERRRILMRDWANYCTNPATNADT